MPGWDSWVAVTQLVKAPAGRHWIPIEASYRADRQKSRPKQFTVLMVILAELPCMGPGGQARLPQNASKTLGRGFADRASWYAAQVISSSSERALRRATGVQACRHLRPAPFKAGGGVPTTDETDPPAV